MPRTHLSRSLFLSPLFLTAWPSLTAQTEVRAFLGNVGPGDGFGAAVASAGDIDRDGRDDLIVGATQPFIGAGSGYARVLSGASGAVLYTFFGDGTDDDFGWSVAGAGDVDGDGVPDVVVGAPEEDDHGDKSGSARVFSGADGRVLHTFYGDAVDESFGLSVAGVGDVNADGFADVAVGATVEFYPNLPPDYVRVFSGRTGNALYTLVGQQGLADRFGYSIAAAGDLDADGHADFAVGAPFATFGNGSSWFQGAVYLISGQRGRVLRVHRGDWHQGYLGYSVAGLGDANGDGIGDVASGEWGFDTAAGSVGRVHVWSGATGLLLDQFTGGIQDSHVGTHVAAAGDLDGDLHGDLLLRRVSDGWSVAQVYSIRLHRPLAQVVSPVIAGSFAQALTGVGDLTGDGRPEILVGVPNEQGANHLGSARLFSLDFAPPWFDLGLGNAGVAGPPRLRGIGTLAPASQLSLLLDRARPSSWTVPVIGFARVDQPLLGGVLVPALHVMLPLATSDSAGRATVTIAVPPVSPPGIEVYFQFWVVDPQASAGAAASNGLLGITP